jgi:C4-dicarboxylate-specific signal transduction histidine kinase
LRWLRRDVPNLEEVTAAIHRVVAEGRRASEVVTRIRAFLKKRPAEQDMLGIAEIIEEAALLVERELSKANITLAIETEPDLPRIRGDRIQLQQVLINLIVNAGQAMSEQNGSEEKGSERSRPRIVTVGAGRAGIASFARRNHPLPRTGVGAPRVELIPTGKNRSRQSPTRH